MAITNGGFETGDGTGWTLTSSGDPENIIEVNSDTSRTGTYALYMRAHVGYPYTWVKAVQNLGVVTKENVLTLWVYKGSSITGLKYRLTGSGIDTGYVSVSSTYYTYVETSIVMEDIGVSDDTEITLELYLLGSSDGNNEDWIDDITLTTPVVTPVASFTYVIIGDSIHFTDISTYTPTSWDWDFGDGSPHSSEQNPIHRYFEPPYSGFTVTLTATNSAGSDSDSVVITEMQESIFQSAIVSTTVSSPGIDGLMHHCILEVDGHPVLPSQDIIVRMPDHNAVEQLVFLGYIPSPSYTTQESKNKIKLTAYSYFWYLTKRYLPPLEDDDTGLQQTYFYNNTDEIVIPTCAVYMEDSVPPAGYTHIDPSLYIRELCEGTNSVERMGITLLTVTDNPDWVDGTLVNTDFGFINDVTSRIDALQKIREYMKYYLREVFIDDTTPTDNLLWVPDSSTDAVLQLPPKVTFTWPDEYVIGAIYGENQAGEKYNSVRVRGYPVMLEESFYAISDPDTFVLDQYGREESVSGTISRGVRTIGPNPPYPITWTYTITDIPLADLTEHNPGGVPGTGVDWVTVANIGTLDENHTAEITLSYLPFNPYYENTIQTSGVTAHTEKEIEAPPIIDTDHKLGLTTQAKVNVYSSDYFDLCQTDPSIYRAILAKRTDLREMQLVRFIGFDKVPEVDMRITHIQYSRGSSGIFVDIEFTPDRIFVLKRALRDCISLSDTGLIERIVHKAIDRAGYETGAMAINVNGDMALVQTDGRIFYKGPVT